MASAAAEEEGGEEGGGGYAGGEGHGHAEAEAFGAGCVEEIGDAHDCHEYGGEHCDHIGEGAARKIDGHGPEGEHGEGLVAPREIAPEDVEIDHHDAEHGGEDGRRHGYAAPEFRLIEVHEVSDHEAGAAQGGVAGGDGGCNHAEQGEHSAN